MILHIHIPLMKKQYKKNEAITSKNITNHDEDDKKNKKKTPRKPVESDSKTPNKKKESKKPEVVIVSFIEGNTANKITKLQDKLIKRGVNGYLKVKEAKIHITHIALYTTENLERIFYATTKKITDNGTNFNFKLGGLKNYNGNLVVEIKESDVTQISAKLMFACIDNQIHFDPRQSSHITLFKPNLKHPNYYNIHTTEKANAYWREYTFNLNDTSITKIVACQKSEGIPELMKYTVKGHNTTVLTKSQKLEHIRSDQGKSGEPLSELRAARPLSYYWLYIQRYQYAL